MIFPRRRVERTCVSGAHAVAGRRLRAQLSQTASRCCPANGSGSSSFQRRRSIRGRPPVFALKRAPGRRGRGLGRGRCWRNEWLVQGRGGHHGTGERQSRRRAGVPPVRQAGRRQLRRALLAKCATCSMEKSATGRRPGQARKVAGRAAAAAFEAGFRSRRDVLGAALCFHVPFISMTAAQIRIEFRLRQRRSRHDGSHRQANCAHLLAARPDATASVTVW